MAFKERVDRTPVEQAVPHPIQVKIEGLRPNFEPGQNENYWLDGVKMVTVDWDAIGKVFEAAGIPKNDAYAYVDDFARQVFQRELAKTLASRITLV